MRLATGLAGAGIALIGIVAGAEWSEAPRGGEAGTAQRACPQAESCVVEEVFTTAGDQNCDGGVDDVDVDLIITGLFCDPCASCEGDDANQDGRVSVADAVAVVQLLGAPTPTPRPTVTPARTVTATATSITAGAPTAVDDGAATLVAEPVHIFVLANDSDPNGDPLNVTDFTQPANGSVSFANNVATYTPGGGFSGTDGFAYTISDGTGGTASATVTVVVNLLPSDPAAVAPPPANGVATTVGDAALFLYTGVGALQFGVPPGTIVPTRAAVVRGKVENRDGTPLAGVRITILGHPEFGFTASRADGMFDMAVNGGGSLVVRYEKAGFLPAQRTVDVPWQDYVLLPDVALIAPDSQVSPIDLSAPGDFQIASGSVVSDIAGTRQATLLFPQGTVATMVMPDGSTQPITNLNVRATEYTVGTDVAAAMPAELPPNSGYTYAVDLSADELLAAGATDVQFSQPVLTYLENFLQAGVGTSVPAGYYDRAKAAWVAAESGRVIQIVSITGSMADVDTDGDAVADNGQTAQNPIAPPLTDAERQRLAALYPVGQTLWRVPVRHFTPWDNNWAFGPPDDGVFPNQRRPDSDERKDKVCKKGRSIIECSNQILGETIGVVGTPFSLNYRSDRVPGRTAANSLTIPLSGPSVPESLARIEVEISVAGRQFAHQVVGRQCPPPCLGMIGVRDGEYVCQPLAAPGLAASSMAKAPPGVLVPQTDLTNQSYTFTWDGKDAYGRTLQGQQPATVRIGYTYCGRYQKTDKFGYNGGGMITGSSTRADVTLWQEWKTAIGPWDARGQGLGGWTLSVHHAYDPLGLVLYLGDGERRSAEGLGPVISTVAGTGTFGYNGDGIPATQARLKGPGGVAVGPDGSIYISDSGNYRVRRVGSDGIISTIAGTGTSGYNGDGIPATQARIGNTSGLAVGPDGSLYIYDGTNYRVRRVTPDGIIHTVAGSGTNGTYGDGIPATQAQIGSLGHVALGPDGTLYIADTFNDRIRRVGTDGIITTVKNNPQPSGIAVGLDGSLYFAAGGVYRLAPDGSQSTFACGGYPGFRGDGGPAAEAGCVQALDVAVARDGSTYFADFCWIRRVETDGIITTVAGTGGYCSFAGDGGPATQGRLRRLFGGLAVGPDGYTLYISDPENYRLRRVGLPLPGSSITDLLIPSEDGSEGYIFSSSGRHLRTVNTLTGALDQEFAYDDEGRLTSITDGNGNLTTVERNANGDPVAIVAPFGQRTLLSVDANGYLASVTNPAGEITSLGYTDDGLLVTFTDPRAAKYRFTYDTLGRLTGEEDPAGGTETLVRTESAGNYEVRRTTGLERSTTYTEEQLSTGDERRVTTFPGGQRTEGLMKTDGSTIFQYADGMTTSGLLGPDPRFGMQAPLVTSGTIGTPGGLTATYTSSRTATLTDPTNPWSLSSLTETVTANGRSGTSVYDATTRAFTDTTPAGRQSTSEIDSLGRLVRSQIGGLFPTQLAYDGQGRLTSMSTGLGADMRQFAFGYGPRGYLDHVTDALSQTVGFEYDLAGRVIKVTMPDGGAVTYTYDANGNVTSIQPPARPAHAFTYTAVNLPAEYIPPDVGTGTTKALFSFNQDRQLTGVVQPDGDTVDFNYDLAGRLSSTTLPGKVIGYEYHPTTGYLTRMSGPGGVTVDYAYDGMVLTGEDWTGPVSGGVRYSYDNDFRVATLAVVGGQSIAFQYDGDGWLTGAGALVLTRHADHGLLTGSSLDAITDAWTYNGFGEAVTYSAAASGEELFRAEYVYDKLGRIVRKTETVEGDADTSDYTYDAVGRLIAVAKNGAAAASYAYDRNGNRLSVTRDGNTTSGTYDARDRLTQHGGATYTYTASGDLASKTTAGGTTTYGYDPLGNLTDVTLPGGTHVEYIVDGRNRRIGKKVNGTLVQGFLYQDQLLPIAELDGSGTVVAHFVYGARGNVPAYMLKGGQTYRLISDHLGSPRLVVDAATGTEAQRIEYDEFGNVLSDSNPGFQPFGFAGGLYDRHSGLVRFGARDYDSEVGRWTAMDPAGFASDDENLYAYVGNDPMNMLDPFGTTPTKGGGGLKDIPGDPFKAQDAANAAEAAKQSALRPAPAPSGPEGSTAGKKIPTFHGLKGKALLDALIKAGVLQGVSRCFPWLQLLQLLLDPKGVCREDPFFPGCNPSPETKRRIREELQCKGYVPSGTGGWVPFMN